jgi:hypothetical protein
MSFRPRAYQLFARWYKRTPRQSVAAHQKTRFLITRRFESKSSASSPKRSGGLSSRTCQSSCCVLDAAMRANASSASALIATAASATAAIFAGSRHGKNNDALLTAATSKPNLAEKLTGYVSAPIADANADQLDVSTRCRLWGDRRNGAT